MHLHPGFIVTLPPPVLCLSGDSSAQGKRDDAWKAESGIAKTQRGEEPRMHRVFAWVAVDHEAAYTAATELGFGRKHLSSAELPVFDMRLENVTHLTQGAISPSLKTPAGFFFLFSPFPSPILSHFQTAKLPEHTRPHCSISLGCPSVLY